MDTELSFHPLIDDMERNWGLRQGEMEISGTNPSILTYNSTVELINRLVPLTTSASSTAGADAEDNDSADPTIYDSGDILHQMLEQTGGPNTTLTPVHTDLMESRKRRLSEFGDMMNTMFQMADEANVRELHDDDAQYRVSRLLEILYYAENIQTGILHLQNLFSTGTDSIRNIPGATSSITMFGKRFRASPEIKSTPHQKLLLSILKTLSILGYKRYHYNVMIPVIINGVYTYSWKKKCSIKDFVWGHINSHLHSENFENATSSKGNIQFVIDFLTQGQQHEFMDLQKERRIHAFRNGIYITSVMDERGLFTPESHMILFESQNPSSDPILKRMTDGGKVAACFHDCNLPPSRDDANPTTFEKISTHQRWIEDVKEWFRAACGRMLHPIASTPSPVTLEKWQVFFLLIGVGNSGKSTTIDNVVYNFFDAEDVAYIQNNLEKQYGWSKCKGKMMWLAPEITGNFADHCDQAQFQQVVEGGRLASAKKYAVETIEFDPFDLPGMMGANETIEFKDNGESVSRRRVDFHFSQIIQHVDPQMPEKLKEELGHIMVRCNEAYLKKTKEVKSRVWDSLPEYFIELRKENAAQTNSLENFLQNGKIEFHPHYYIIQTEFQRLYKQYCKTNDIIARTLKRDFYEAPFMKRNLTVIRDIKIDPIENVPKQALWILGVRAMREDALEFFSLPE
jgi:hypothetical protein